MKELRNDCFIDSSSLLKKQPIREDQASLEDVKKWKSGQLINCIWSGGKSPAIFLGIEGTRMKMKMEQTDLERSLPFADLGLTPYDTGFWNPTNFLQKR